MDLSIVTSLYRSAPYLTEFCRRAEEAARSLGGEYEIVLVNDGSPDDALDIAIALVRGNPRIRVVDLARNYGQHKALMTGLAHARGRRVFMLDSDLEEAPELLTEFDARMRETRADVVYGVQAARKGGWLERVSGDLFYRFFNWAAAEAVPRDALCARLMTRAYVTALLSHTEREVFLQGLWATTGFRQIPVVAAKGGRGSSGYTLARKVGLAVNALTSFSNRPLILVFYAGFVIFLVATIAAIYLMIRRLFFGALLMGWPSLIVSVWLLGGLTLLAIGVVGIYLSKVFTEVKQRPNTVVRHVYSASALRESRDDD
jgi:putative glycosyltransferase